MKEQAAILEHVVNREQVVRQGGRRVEEEGADDGVEILLWRLGALATIAVL
eukprot:CAMPEP_0172565490 /NCGR_PEP_ID=MMETSP1067-20121228/108304_1 /TAXON_ID=265564 ORGANISM="Thalassiosira punctigera, Strain Tpunct2005C2" /NCGR_SAMPLE_ID=MMETSP1067 /ASSEMBLY_ACC=CAM_ASM_000444 /LENGTH=50 /DNA_ID=CAMNT_0013356367 /DNA_START=300 /DNA_END=452 /DNA_ORIENTATION=+